MEEKIVYSSTNTIEIDHVCSLLNENNIPFIKKTEGAGDYLNIVTGNLLNNYTEILVSADDYDKACELVKSISNGNINLKSQDLPDELKSISKDEEKELADEAEKTKNYLRFFLAFFILLPVLIFIIMIIAARH